MGYEFYPQALAATIRRAWEVTDHVPVLVTENGIGTDDDEQRIAYVAGALEGVLDCLDDGIDVRGYTYWSAAGQLRVGLRLRAPLRHGRGRPHHPAAHGQAERPLVGPDRPGQPLSPRLTVSRPTGGQ